jgi:ribonuclease P protein component
MSTEPQQQRQSCRGWAVIVEALWSCRFLSDNTREHSREQADLPAQQPAPAQEARLPAAHAYPRRPGRSGQPSQQGPSAAGRLTPLVHGRVLTGSSAGGRVLSASHRLRRSADFTAVVRRGRRAGRSTLVVHLLPVADAADVVPGSEPENPAPARCGFVVSKAVGSAAERNTVKRRLRHLMREKMPLLPEGSRLVVRALPAATTADFDALGADLDSALRRVLRRGGVR